MHNDNGIELLDVNEQKLGVKLNSRVIGVKLLLRVLFLSNIKKN